MTISLFILTTLVPVIAWVWFIRRSDTVDVEPWKLIILTFFLGIVAAGFALVIEAALVVFLLPEDSTFLTNLSEFIRTYGYGAILGIFLISSIVEEWAKYIVFRICIYKREEVNQVADGIYYMFLVGLGFATIENVMYFYSFTVSYSLVAIVVLSFFRSIFTLWMHMTSAGIVGYALGRRKFDHTFSRYRVLFAFLLAVLLHLVYNFFNLIPWGIYINMMLVPASFGALMHFTDLPRSIMIWNTKKGTVPPPPPPNTPSL